MLEETDYLDSFQFGFRLGYSTKRKLVVLPDDNLWWNWYGGDIVIIMVHRITELGRIL